MEFLFITQWASAEAILLFVCLGIFAIIYGYDGYLFLRQFIQVFFPKKVIPEPVAIENTEFDTIPESQEDTVTAAIGESIEGSRDEPQEETSIEVPETDEIPTLITEGVNISGDSEAEVVGVIDTVPQENTENIPSEESIGEVSSEGIIVAVDITQPEELVISSNESIQEEVIEENVENTQETIEEPTTENIQMDETPVSIEQEEVSEVSEDIIPETINVGGELEQKTIEQEYGEESTSIIDLEAQIIQESVTQEVISEYRDEPITEIVSESLPEPQPIEESITEKIVENHTETIEPIESSDVSTPEMNRSFLEEDYSMPRAFESTRSFTKVEPKKSESVKLSPQVQEKIYQLLGSIKTLMARGQTLEARGLIIQGLALHQEHRDLNIILGGLFEQDHHFDKAEFIYKDLAEWYPNDIEILEKLGNVLIIQRRYTIAYEIYKKILFLGGDTEAALYIITHLASELGLNEEKYDLSKRYLKQWPNNPEILSLLAQSEIILGLRQDAIKTLIKLKNLTPYNGEIMETVQKLMMEEEMAGNFGG